MQTIPPDVLDRLREVVAVTLDALYDLRDVVDQVVAEEQSAAEAA